VIGRLARRAALAATLISLVGSAPAAADIDQYGNSLFFGGVEGAPVHCNPSRAFLSVAQTLAFTPLFAEGVLWVDYFGVPVAVSQPFALYSVPIRKFGAILNMPSPSSLLPGQITLHVLLQGNGAFDPPLYFLFTTVSDTATIDPSLPFGCTPTAISASASASGSVLARRQRAVRRASSKWFRDSLAPPTKYPKARLCGRTVCIQLRPGAVWKAIPITRR
jgi:hypothetical protein